MSLKNGPLLLTFTHFVTKIFALHVDQFHADASEGENRHFKLQRAIEEMKRLDDILSAKIFKLKEVRRQRKEFQAKLWQEFKVDTPLYPFSFLDQFIRLF